MLWVPFKGIFGVFNGILKGSLGVPLQVVAGFYSPLKGYPLRFSKGWLLEELLGWRL